MKGNVPKKDTILYNDGKVVYTKATPWRSIVPLEKTLIRLSESNLVYSVETHAKGLNKNRNKYKF